MPVAHQLIPEKRLVVLTYGDPVTYDEWSAALHAVFANPSYRPGFNLLVDRRDSTPPTRLFADAIATFIRKHRESLGTARIAILVSDVAAFGMARMQEMLNESAALETRAFRSESAALEWLAANSHKA
jgi:hypothetical protein